MELAPLNPQNSQKSGSTLGEKNISSIEAQLNNGYENDKVDKNVAIEVSNNSLPTISPSSVPQMDYNCLICGKIFRIKAQLLAHFILNHCSKNEKISGNHLNPQIRRLITRFNCCQCRRSFHSFSHLSKHRVVAHRTQTIQATYFNPNLPSTSTAAFSSRHAISETISGIPRLTNGGISNGLGKKHKSRSIKSRTCPICSTVLPNSLALQTHMTARHKTYNSPVVQSWRSQILKTKQKASENLLRKKIEKIRYSPDSSKEPDSQLSNEVVSTEQSEQNPPRIKEIIKIELKTINDAICPVDDKERPSECLIQTQDDNSLIDIMRTKVEPMPETVHSLKNDESLNSSKTQENSFESNLDTTIASTSKSILLSSSTPVTKSKSRRKTKPRPPCNSFGAISSDGSNILASINITEGIDVNQAAAEAGVLAVKSGVPIPLDRKGRPCTYPCPACPRRFAFQCRLAAHLRCHTNIRPFTCSDCGRAFTQKGYLARHAAVHKYERPFSCKICERTYKHYGSLVNHKRTHNRSGTVGNTSGSTNMSTSATPLVSQNFQQAAASLLMTGGAAVAVPTASLLTAPIKTNGSRRRNKQTINQLPANARFVSFTQPDAAAVNAAAMMSLQHLQQQQVIQFQQQQQAAMALELQQRVAAASVLSKAGQTNSVANPASQQFLLASDGSLIIASGTSNSATLMSGQGVPFVPITKMDELVAAATQNIDPTNPSVSLTPNAGNVITLQQAVSTTQPTQFQWQTLNSDGTVHTQLIQQPPTTSIAGGSTATIGMQFLGENQLQGATTYLPMQISGTNQADLQSQIQQAATIVNAQDPNAGAIPLHLWSQGQGIILPQCYVPFATANQQ